LIGLLTQTIEVLTVN